MSALRPVGPLPARVYWVRRSVVLAGIILVLLIALWAWGAVSGAGSDGTSAHPGGSQSPTVSPTDSQSPTASPTVSPTVSPSQSATATGTPACEDSAIQVLASTSSSTYPPDQDPRLTIKVTNTSKKACKRDVGQKAMEVKVSAGDTLIWSSDHCAPGGSAKVITLSAGESYTTSVVWTRTESKKDCPANQPAAPAGTYALSGRNLSVVSAPVAFALA